MKKGVALTALYSACSLAQSASSLHYCCHRGRLAAGTKARSAAHIAARQWQSQRWNVQIAVVHSRRVQPARTGKKLLLAGMT